MADLDKIVKTPESTLDELLIKLCKSISAKRARIVIDHILTHGIVTNEELNELYGYDHPPRAIRDVRENGIPLITYSVVSPKSGRRMGAYTFDDISKIKRGRIGGRNAFPKKFKEELIDMYGAIDAITGAKMNPRYLQIDHRIPYEVAGENNDNSEKLNAKDFMFLDSSSNRAKSWSCEQCDNLKTKHSLEICSSCFWASPEDYSHIAEKPTRRIDITWNGDEIKQYEALKEESEKQSIDISALIKQKLSD